MLYHLFDYLEKTQHLPGASLFTFITFRAGVAIILSLIISVLIGNRIIEILRRKQVGESIRDLGLDGQLEKQGTPTMGGIIIIASVVIPTLLLADITNIYIILMLISAVWMGIIGFADDYIKVFKKNKQGLKKRFKIFGQVALGLLVAVTMLGNKDVVVRMDKSEAVAKRYEIVKDVPESAEVQASGRDYVYVKSSLTNVPFFKGNRLDYQKIAEAILPNWKYLAWVIFIPFVILVVTAVSNAANLTDGIDGLAAGTSAIIAGTLAILAYVSSNTLIANYLNILYIPYSDELVIFCTALLGSCIGFLWYNAYPAKVFMGDTGSLALGSVIAVLAILIRKELLIPILCGIFVIENLSVVMQVAYFKYTRRKYGEGRRIFKMSPLHHHFQKLGMHESKIVTRFWIVGILLAVITIVTLKVR
jgi:phospho-N-acetylmuramoyl-pentapeptide-transferase